MQLNNIITSSAMLAGTILAQSSKSNATMTSTGSAPLSTATNLAGLVNQLPTCALDCLDQAAHDVNCVVSDLPCLCRKKGDLVGSIGPCILLSTNCSREEQNSELQSPPEKSISSLCMDLKPDIVIFKGLATLSETICDDISTSTPSEIAAASSAVMSVVATAYPNSAASVNSHLALRADAPAFVVLVIGVTAALAMVAL